MAPRKLSSLSFGMVDGRPLFLDLERDAYFLLEQNAEATFLKERQDTRLGDDEACRSSQLDGQAAREALAPIARVGLAQDAPRSNSYSVSTIDAGAACLRARWMLRIWPLAGIINDLSSSPRGAFSSAVQTACAAAAFIDARRRLPLAPHCLKDSLALLYMLRSRDMGATLIFGAKLDPFAAHCWVQCAEIVLNDEIERVERFTPVRTVET